MQSTQPTAVHVPPDVGQAVWFAGDTYTLKLAGEQTGGAFALGEVKVSPGGGSQLHATNADVGTVEVAWIDEEDPYVNPPGAKGIGELGIIGTAAIANTIHHATGVRDPPITLDKLL